LENKRELKKPNYKTVLRWSAWLVVLSALVFSLGFVSGREKKIVAKTLDIEILNNEDNFFLNEQDVKRFFDDRKDAILEHEYKDIRIPELEKALNSHPAIENAEVSATLNGEVKVNITQRTPRVRIINKNGESYYIDTRSKLMPLNENYSARVIVANGEIDEPFDRRQQFSVDQIRNNKTFRSISLLDDILDAANYIEQDTLLHNLIHQIYVNSEKELELYPVVGCQKIILGDALLLDEKFNKLKLFYKQGLNKTNSWQRYSTINLKYRNMVVCTKK
jgi:cell division protein FtsQ